MKNSPFKRIIAICLCLFCMSVSVVGYCGDQSCGKCGSSNTTKVKMGSWYSPAGMIMYHNFHERYMLRCNMCGEFSKETTVIDGPTKCTPTVGYDKASGKDKTYCSKCYQVFSYSAHVHRWNGTKCKDCGATHQHNYKNNKCTICGMKRN